MKPLLTLVLFVMVCVWEVQVAAAVIDCQLRPGDALLDSANCEPQPVL